MEKVVKVEITDSTIHLSNERWKVSVPYHKLPDGTVVVGGGRVFGPALDPDSPGQWGREGGGGGGGGGHSGGGGAPHVPHAPPMPAQRSETPFAVRERFFKAVDFWAKKLDGLEIIGGGSGRSPRSKYWKRERQRIKAAPATPSAAKKDRSKKRGRTADGDSE